ncbi:MAG: glycine/sarcosine/betaine reductase component B subunit, partial [Lachnospiraceae bacterium]
MKLELGNIKIKDLQFSDCIEVKEGIVTVCKEELEKLVLEDERIISVKFEIAKPGESVRITPVKDVIEPRVKVSGSGKIFPGIIAKVKAVGSGRTHALVGMNVVTVGKIVGFQEGVIDMSGPAAAYCPFSKTLNLCMVLEPKEGLETHQYEEAARLAGFKVGVR